MRELRERGTNHSDSSGFWIKFFLFISLAVFFLVAYSLVKETRKKYQIQKEVDKLKEEAVSLEQGNQKLKGLIDYFETDNFSEKEAREKLNVKKEGEKLVILKEQEIVLDKEEEESGEEDVKPDIPNWLKWFEYFFSDKSN